MADLLEVGWIGKAHGLRGEVTVKLTTTEASRLAPGSELRSGERTLRVVGSRRHQDRWIVAFEGVADRNAAEALRGSVLVAEPLEDDGDPDALWIHELVGAEVIDTTGAPVGVVESVEANPASDLLVLDTGTLVPLTFVTGWVERPRRLGIDPPPGLVD